MWILKHLSSDLQFSLLPKKDVYTVGRSGVDFVLPGDKTISRHHASLCLSPNGTLEIIDEASKYKIQLKRGASVTYIEAKTKVELNDGDTITFGRGKFEFIIKNHKFNCLTSNISAGNRQELESFLKTFSGVVEEKISENCTYLVMTQAIMTLKLLQAMVTGIEIVNVKYFRDVMKAISNTTIFPDAQMYRPNLNEQFVLSKHISFNIIPQRSQLFKNKTIYFLSMRQYSSYKEIIEGASGRCLCIKNQTVSKNALVANNSIVIQAGTEATQMDSVSQSKVRVAALETYIRSKGMRLIPIDEIHLAVLNSSCEKYCNPFFVFDAVNEGHTVRNSSTIVGDSSDSVPLKIQHSSIEPQPSTSKTDQVIIDSPDIDIDSGLIINDKKLTQEPIDIADRRIEEVIIHEEEVLQSKQVDISYSNSFQPPINSPRQEDDEIVLTTKKTLRNKGERSMLSFADNNNDETEHSDSDYNPFGFKAFKKRKRVHSNNNDDDFMRAPKLQRVMQTTDNTENDQIMLPSQKDEDRQHKNLTVIKKENLHLYTTSIQSNSTWITKIRKQDLDDVDMENNDPGDIKTVKLENLFEMKIKKNTFNCNSQPDSTKNYKRFVKVRQTRSESGIVPVKSHIIGETQFS